MLMNRSSCLAMKSGTLILAVALGLLVGPVQAQVIVNWGAQIDNGLGTSGGTELPIGALIRIGSFNLTDAQIQQNQSDINFLNAAFRQFGTATIGEGFDPAVPAHWAKSTSGSTDALGINGQRIYYWAFNASSIGAATEQGIFTSSIASWLFPPDGPLIPNSTTVDLREVAHQVGPGAIVVGSFGHGTSSASGADLYNLTPIPEPSAYAAVFAVICLVGGVWLRRSKGHPNLA